MLHSKHGKICRVRRDEEKGRREGRGGRVGKRVKEISDKQIIVHQQYM